MSSSTLTRLRPREEWSEDDGPVLWWTMPLREAPYVGSPLYDDFPNYVTHWTPIPEPKDDNEIDRV